MEWPKLGVSSNSLKIKIINISLDLSLFYTWNPHPTTGQKFWLVNAIIIIIQYPSARAASVSLPDLHLLNELLIGVQVACIILIIKQLLVHAVLSTLPDNPGDSRFWTVSPSLHLDYSLKSPGWSAKLAISSVDLTFWQRNFNYFALFGLYYVNIVCFLVNFIVIQ